MGGFLSGRTSLTTVQTANLAADAITTAKILDGAVTAAKIASGVISDSSSDMRLAFLMIAENQGDRLNLDDGIADPFKDETDIDTSTSTNETYNAAGDYYSGLATASDSSFGEPSGGSYTISSGGHWGLGWEAGATGNIGTVKINIGTAGSGSGPDNVRLVLYTDDSGSPGVTIGSVSDTIDCETTGDKIFTFATPPPVTSGTDYWLVGERLTSTGEYYVDIFTSGTSDWLSARNVAIASMVSDAGSLGGRDWRIEINIQSATNMTLVSNAFTATAVPATGRIHIQVNPVDAITINTDLTAEISRDGGTTWTAATLALVETLKDGTLAYEDNSVTISGQPSGTAMKYRIKTLNTKNVQVHGAVFQWST